MSALSRHMKRYPKARPSTLRQKAKEDAMAEALRADVRMMRRRRLLASVKRVLMPWVR